MEKENCSSPIIQKHTRGWILVIKVVPKAAQNQIMGIEGEALKIRLQAIPEKGKANKELISFLAKKLDLSPSYIEIISGESSPKKRVLIQKISLEELKDKLGL